MCKHVPYMTTQHAVPVTFLLFIFEMLAKLAGYFIACSDFTGMRTSVVITGHPLISFLNCSVIFYPTGLFQL